MLQSITEFNSYSLFSVILVFLHVFFIVFVFYTGWFFNCFSQFSEPKWKTMGSQSVILFHEILDVQKILVGSTTFFFLALKLGQLKKPPCIFTMTSITFSQICRLLPTLPVASRVKSILGLFSSRKAKGAGEGSHLCSVSVTQEPSISSKIPPWPFHTCTKLESISLARQLPSTLCERYLIKC